MQPDEIVRYITANFQGVNHAMDGESSFFIYDPDRNLPPAQQMPFATLVVDDKYDQVSNLNRPGVFRLNIGTGKKSFRELFPEYDPAAAWDFKQLDKFLPHPVYGRMHWICVLNPSETTFKKCREYLAEAYELAVSRLHRT